MKIIIMAALALLLLLASGCEDRPAIDAGAPEPAGSAATGTPDAPSPTPAVTPGVTAAPSPPQETGGVWTDYSAYAPYARKSDEIFTRLSDDYLPGLIPSANYGTLAPYIGEAIGDSYVGPIIMQGLCTLDGMIVTDPVFKRIYQPSKSYGYKPNTYYPVYQLERPMTEKENRAYYDYHGIEAKHDYDDEFGDGDGYEDEYGPPQDSEPPRDPFVVATPTIAVCALDGSWVTDYYFDVEFCDNVILLDRGKHVDVYDYNGNFLYNTDILSGYSICTTFEGEIAIRDWTDCIGLKSSYGDGYFLLRTGKGKYTFFDVLTRDANVTGYEGASPFLSGRAAVKQGGLWGYIDAELGLAIDFQFEEAGRFVGDYASCKLPDGRYVLIDKDGAIQGESDQRIYIPATSPYEKPEPEFVFVLWHGTDVRDKAGNVLFTYSGELAYLEQIRMFSVSVYKGTDWYGEITAFELYNPAGKCVFRKNVISPWSDD